MINVYRRSLYSVKLMFSGYFIGAFVLGLLFSLVAVNIENWNFSSASISSLIVMFNVVMPIFTVVLTANAFAEEFEELTFPLIWTYPNIKPFMLIERLLMIVLLLVIYFSATLAAIDIWLLELTREDIWTILKVSLPVHLFFVGITSLFSFIGRNMLVGLAAGAIYWLIEMVTRGLWTKQMFLFQPVWPRENVDSVTNGWLVTGAGLLFIGFSILLFVFGRSWIAKGGR